MRPCLHPIVLFDHADTSACAKGLQVPAAHTFGLTPPACLACVRAAAAARGCMRCAWGDRQLAARCGTCAADCATSRCPRQLARAGSASWATAIIVIKGHH